MTGPDGPDRSDGPDRLAALRQVLERARSVGFLGPGPVDDHVANANRFVDALSASGVGRGPVADLGAGGGVPGLVVSLADPSRELVLIDAAQKRCSFLVWALAELGLDGRSEVWCARAEELGREPRVRERFEAVVARGFGPPATTLECAAPLVRPGGWVIVSEPPTRRRWPADGVGQLALVEAPPLPGVARFERGPGLDDRYPRSAKQQQRAPLFDVE